MLGGIDRWQHRAPQKRIWVLYLAEEHADSSPGVTEGERAPCSARSEEGLEDRPQQEALSSQLGQQHPPSHTQSKVPSTETASAAREQAKEEGWGQTAW